MTEVRGALEFAGLFLVLLLTAEVWARWLARTGRATPAHCEWTRKFVHLGGGVLALFLPHFVSRWETVLVLAGALAFGFILGRRLGLLASVDGVERRSRGTEYFPIAIFAVFVLSGERPWIYVSSILVLATADAFAALVGEHYGKFRYMVEDRWKTVEGSFSFFLLAFLAVHLPVLLMTDLPRLHCVLVAVLIALLATAFEAVSLGGKDNLFIPIGVCLLLRRCAAMPPEAIAVELAVFLAAAAALGFLSTRARTFNTGATILFLLFAQAVWTIGSITWLAPVILGIVSYTILRRFVVTPGSGDRIRVRVTLRAVTVPLLFLVLGVGVDDLDLFYPAYVAACSAVLAFTIWNHRCLFREERLVHDSWWNGLVALVSALVTLLTVAAVGEVFSIGTSAMVILGTVFVAVLNDIHMVRLGIACTQLRQDDFVIWGRTKQALTLLAGVPYLLARLLA